MSFLKRIAAGIVLAAAAAPLAATAESLPNFVIIMADDLGYGDLSCYGGWIQTPGLDALAAEGLRFTDFHSSGNVCSPTRAGLLTGRYQQRAGIPGVIFADPQRPQHLHGLQPEEFTFAEALRAAGYATAIYGKWHLGYDRKYNPIHQGFDDFRGFVSGNVDFFSHVDQAGNYDWWHGDQQVVEPGYTTELITRHAIRFIEANRERPFCLYLPHEAPHSPYQGPGDSPLRSVGDGSLRGQRTDIREAYREMVEALDEGIAEVVETIRSQGLAERTLVFFCSDNGATRNGSNGPLRGFKGSDWEGGHRVPAIAWWPGRIAPGGTTDELSITLDIMPTLVSLAGAELPADLQLDGVDLSRLLLEGRSLGNRQLFWNGVAMRDGPWKLMREGPQRQPALYNLADDLGETNNLAAAHPQRVQAMLASLRDWEQDVMRSATPQPSR